MTLATISHSIAWSYTYKGLYGERNGGSSPTTPQRQGGELCGVLHIEEHIGGPQNVCRNTTIESTRNCPMVMGASCVDSLV
jgi:hypothetical protein